jgi:hypothetical protein
MAEMLRYASLEEIKTFGDDQCIDMCLYFEDGCLCIHSGDLPVLFDKTPQEQYHHYLQGCKCSRHPDGELKSDHTR